MKKKNAKSKGERKFPIRRNSLSYFENQELSNVHLSNSLQLIQALQNADKSFEVQVGPDRGHTAVSTDRMMEFFIQNLVLEN